ncbi:MAG: hypothetical protein PUP91_18695 [Rhizonema sp. PD37]|nr:hypothetical protein [Rhizonema sp. PD37]
MMVKNLFFTTVAVVGILSAIASQTKAQQQPLMQQSIKIPLAGYAYANGIASSMPSRSLAKAPIQTNRAVPNGFNIIPTQNSQGHGKLKIINGTNTDAAVKLFDNSSKKIWRFVYVQANHEMLLEKISPCNCTLRFTLGKDWDKTTRKFLHEPSFFQFVEPLNYSESSSFTSPDKLWYSKYTVTLNSVPFGNTQAKSLSERDF